MNIKKQITILILILFCVPLAGEDELSSIDGLIENRQYLSALRKIQDADPQSENPQYLQRKLDLSLNYSVRHIQGMDAYAFTDLAEGETLNDLQNRPPVRKYPVHTWPIDETIQRHEESMIDIEPFVLLALDYYERNCATEGGYSGIDGPRACEKAHSIATKAFKVHGYTRAICQPYLQFSVAYGAPEKTDLVFDACLEQSPNNPKLLITKAFHLSQTERIEEAIKLGVKVAEISNDPELSGRSYYFVGQLYFEKGDYSNAERFYRSSIDTSPSGLITLENYFRAMLMQEEYEKAKSEFGRILHRYAAIRPPYIDGVRVAYRESNRLSEFVTIAQQLADESSTGPLNQIILYRTLALAQIELQQYKNAQENINKGLKLNATLSSPYHAQISAEFHRLADEIAKSQPKPQ